jgi:hypothetical protein
LQQRAAADSHINGCEGKRIPDLTRQSGFNGNAKPLISLIGSPVINGNATSSAPSAGLTGVAAWPKIGSA